MRVVHGKPTDGQIQVPNNGVSYTLGYDAAGHATTHAFYQGGMLSTEVTNYDPRGQRTTVTTTAS